MTASLLLSIKRITISYAFPNLSDLVLLDSAHCDITKGRLHLLRGENGSGKTSFLRCIVGLQQPESRFISLPGSEIAISGAELVKRIRTGYIPQFPHEAMVPDLPVIENLYLRSILFAMRGTATPFGWFKRLTCISSLKAFRETFIQMPGAEELLKGRHFDNCRSFSGGELQMLNLMALTCANIELLIMDEPTSKLDDANRMRFWALVAELMKGREFTVIATTHEASVFNSNTTGCDPIFMQIHNQKIEIDCGGHDTERKTLHASSA